MLVLAILGVGYILGVWTACIVFGQAQREYEEAAPRTSAARATLLIPLPIDSPRPRLRRL